MIPSRRLWTLILGAFTMAAVALTCWFGTPTAVRTYLAELPVCRTADDACMIVVSDPRSHYWYRRTACPSQKCVLEDIPAGSVVSRVHFDGTDVDIESIVVPAVRRVGWLQELEVRDARRGWLPDWLDSIGQMSPGPQPTRPVSASVVYTSVLGVDDHASVAVGTYHSGQGSSEQAAATEPGSRLLKGESIGSRAVVPTAEVEELAAAVSRSWRSDGQERSLVALVPGKMWRLEGEGVSLYLRDVDLPDEVGGLVIAPEEREVSVDEVFGGCFDREFVGYKVVWDRVVRNDWSNDWGARVQWAWEGVYSVSINMVSGVNLKFWVAFSLMSAGF